MLVIRLQRAGRTHYAMYRIVVQDSRRHPSSGKVVDYVGSFNPHSKEVEFDKSLVEKYLANGAQPSTRVARLLSDAKVKLPSWVKLANKDKKRSVRNPEKLRKNQPKEEVKQPSEESADTSAEEK